jgi:ABC-type Fe3+ transport system substrate-binding protein
MEGDTMKQVTFLLFFLIAQTLFAAESSWQQEWERVLAAAKREGKVAVTGPAGVEPRQALVEPFQKKYGIRVDFVGFQGRELGPKILSERAAGQFLWDVFITGTTTALEVMIPNGLFVSLEPALILPEVKDPKNWRGDALEFLDPERQLLVMTPSGRGVLSANTNLVKVSEFKSYRDVLNPKWKGKIVIDDPRRAGPGQGAFTFFYVHPELGPEFVRGLGRQEPLILRDLLQEVDFVAHGRYPLLIGPDVPVETRNRQGAPITVVDPRQLREGQDLSPKNGNVALYKNAPQPNAAKVYVNWLLSKEGQTVFAQNMGYVSARKDVSTDHVAPWRVPQPGAIRTYTPEAMRTRDRLMPLLEEIFGR